MHGARSSCGNIAASTWIGASTSQLLEFGCYPTGVEPLSRNDKLILADNHVEANAESSISESVHGPVGAGTNCGTTHDGSTHSSDNQLMSITDLETKRFRDAGDMRSEADGNCSNVNSYLMETSVAPEVKIFKGSQSIEIHRMSTSAQLDGSNDQRTHGIRIDGSGRAAIPYCQLSSSCGSQPSRAIGGGWTGSSSARGIGPPEQGVYLVEQDKLLSDREMDTVELPRLGSSWSIFGFDAFSSWCAAVRDAARADGPQISRWWSGTIAEAERRVRELVQSGDAQDCFGKTIVELAASSVPQRYLQTDVCMQPRILKALPVFIQ